VQEVEEGRRVRACLRMAAGRRNGMEVAQVIWEILLRAVSSVVVAEAVDQKRFGLRLCRVLALAEESAERVFRHQREVVGP